jgi:hypothetical protein
MSKDVRSFTSKGRSNVTCLPLLYCWALILLQYRAYLYALSLLVNYSPTHSCVASQSFGMGSINTGLDIQFGGLKLHLVAKLASL